MMDLQDINKVLENSISQRRKLHRLYAAIPLTRCRRQTTCCMMLPEMTLIEALVALDRIKKMAAAGQTQILKNLLKYFFLNAVEITACPFLEGPTCLIYPDRFFGCRAYGLWSHTTYDNLSDQTRAAKQHLQKQWASLGVTLPETVTGFEVAYCPYVEIVDGGKTNDQQLDEIARNIDELSRHFGNEDNAFRHNYLLDLSFLIASCVYGYTKAVQLKFTFVKDFISTGNRSKLDKMLSSLSDAGWSAADGTGERPQNTG